MKKILFFLSALISINYAFAQNKLNDEAIVSQHKRMVFERWGDWRPYGKYVLGIQTNFAYSTAWGMLSPAKNKEYKNGADIRPLKPTGLEVQRLGEVELQRKDSEKIKLEIDSLYQRNIQEMAHWTALTVDADPLWLLYYKRMLNPLDAFPDHPSNYIDWQLKDDKSYQTLKSTGTIEALQEQLDILKKKYKTSRMDDMPVVKDF